MRIRTKTKPSFLKRQQFLGSDLFPEQWKVFLDLTEKSNTGFDEILWWNLYIDTKAISVPLSKVWKISLIHEVGVRCCPPGAGRLVDAVHNRRITNFSYTCTAFLHIALFQVCRLTRADGTNKFLGSESCWQKVCTYKSRSNKVGVCLGVKNGSATSRDELKKKKERKGNFSISKAKCENRNLRNTLPEVTRLVT